MRTPEETDFLIGEILRRLANIIRIGKVVEVNYQNQKAKVKLGELQTGYLPWVIDRAGSDRSWKPIDVGEQVVVLAPYGELKGGVILPSLYQKTYSCPTPDKNKHTIIWEDGSTAVFDKKTSSLNVEIKGKVTVNIIGDAQISAQNVSITAQNTTVNGNAVVTGNATVNGSVSLAGGGPAVARVGDKVSVDPNTHQGSILSGSGKVTAGG